VLAQLVPERLPEHEVERLGRRVRGDERAALQTRQGRHQQDPAAPALRHRATVLVRQQDGPPAVDVDRLLLAGNVLVEEAPDVGVRRVVHEESDLEVARRCTQALRHVAVPQVDDRGPDLDAVGASDRIRVRLERLGGFRHEHEVEPQRGEL
jgi:hypothetical protein